MREELEKVEQEGFIGKIYQDECIDSPRNWDNLGKMVCFHSRYSLGDKHNIRHEDFNGWNEMEEYIKKELDAVVILPLFLYDHSGLSMKTFSHGQHASWDGGYVGFIYATKTDILKNWDKKKLTKSLLENATKYLEGEVESYNQYLQGDVYLFHIEDENGEVVDSCGGFYGLESAVEEVKSQISYYAKEKAENLKATRQLVFG